MHQRRRLLWFGLAAGVAAGTGVLWRSSTPAGNHRDPMEALSAAMTRIETISRVRLAASDTGFGWSETLQHLAQSIEYSMLGFPQAKPAAFQATVGRAAFAVFDWRGAMTHGLDEPIPGAPALDAVLDEEVALRRLRQAVDDFLAFRGELQPHFAYGTLDPCDYARAHALHLADHLAAFGVTLPS